MQTAKPNAKKLIESCAAAFDRIRKREEAELRKLSSNPELYDALQVFADRVYGVLSYLCNFKSVVGNDGKRYPVQDVISRLQDDTAETFESLTGREYLPETVRTHRRQRSTKK